MIDEDFAAYVMYGVDGEDFPPESYSCEDLCTSCKFFKLFGGNCHCFQAISCIGYDNKGNNIVAACGSYDKIL